MGQHIFYRQINGIDFFCEKAVLIGHGLYTGIIRLQKMMGHDFSLLICTSKRKMAYVLLFIPC